jgi:FAD/FMN-containing dehydrogenase
MTAQPVRFAHNKQDDRKKLNDVHSKLNPTRARECVEVCSAGDVLVGLERARKLGLPVSVCGGRHAMGGQQFASGGLVLDMNGLDRVLNFDPDTGQIEVEAGIQWPQLLREYQAMQEGRKRQWGIRQKQTGADRLSIGGAVAANIHGRVLDDGPLVEDIVALRIVDPEGRLLTLSRTENADLFRLVIGGYGLFGVIISVTLQLVPRQKLMRVVEIRELEEIIEAMQQRVRDGFLYGDFQFVTDEQSRSFLQRGVFSCYRPVDLQTPIPEGQIYMSEGRWQDLLVLAHRDKSRAFREFSNFYLSSNEQVYWSDTHQLSLYLDDYHSAIDDRLCSSHRGTEMITELYVPRERLVDFMNLAGQVIRSHDADLIYGTVRLIRNDNETFLAWAREDYACVIFNLHVEHSRQGIAASAGTFRALIDAALWHGGSFFLTYHRHATAQQVRIAYPQFANFLREKKLRDPQQLFASDWYRHYADLFVAADEQQTGAE